ncbi:MAG: hypothetical protein HY052_09120 [Proteobacteria bacterium]|nr:hypothetical protein [Pseudomonadota bacterium]
MSPIVTLLSDIVIVIALSVTVFYCLRLSKQFNHMQANRKAFEALIQSLNIATARAEAVIRSLKEAALDSGDMIQEKIGRARALSDELEIMIQAGDSLANRLQLLAEKGRKSTAAEAPSGISEPSGAEPQPKTRVEKELLEALREKQP